METGGKHTKIKKQIQKQALVLKFWVDGLRMLLSGFPIMYMHIATSKCLKVYIISLCVIIPEVLLSLVL